MSARSDALVRRIRGRLRDAADPRRAAGQQAYMKSQMPFLGVRVPVVRALVLECAAGPGPAALDDLTAAAVRLWREATYREERYAATALTGLRPARGRLELLDLHTEMISTGAWWDHCDEVARRIGDLLLAHPHVMRQVVLRWAGGADRWLRRASIICQVGLADRTDTGLLREVIGANADSPDVFHRKAIGWALRDYARTDPAWVRSFLDSRGTDLSGLSRREAAKHLGDSRAGAGGSARPAS